MMVRKPDFKFQESPSKTRLRRGPGISAIIIHHNAVPDLLSFLLDPSSRVSYHYIIDRDGQITQMVEDEGGAWHSGYGKLFGTLGNPNDYSIGIGLAGDGNKDRFRPLQMVRLEQLVAYLTFMYSVPLNRIVGHQDVDPDRKTDPGRLFPWHGFLVNVAKRMIITKNEDA